MAFTEILEPRFDLVEAAVAEELMEQARQAAGLSYRPYSEFPVGSAVKVKRTGEIITGGNVEIAAYRLGGCSESVALMTAAARGFRIGELGPLAVTCLKGDASDSNSNMPCGGCRQTFVEFMGPEEVVIVDKVGQFLVGHLLPMPFKLQPAQQ
jgi:cytidine deaminase